MNESLPKRLAQCKPKKKVTNIANALETLEFELRKYNELFSTIRESGHLTKR